MYIHVEAVSGQKPIIRVILDHDEKEPATTEVKKLLMDAGLCVPRDKGKMTWIRLEKPKDS